jgi:hypothetical protein
MLKLMLLVVQPVLTLVVVEAVVVTIILTTVAEPAGRVLW